MRVYKKYLTASFSSFLIHALIILYLLNFFEITPNNKRILSKPINVNLILKEDLNQKDTSSLDSKPKKEIISQIEEAKVENISNKSISFDSLIESTNVSDLLQEDSIFLIETEENQIDLYSALIIESIQSAWRKPINIQDGLVCNLRLSINQNGRVVNVNLIKSSGNIRFDNSALKAVQRVETFNFFNKIPFNIYSSNFKNIVITFNPS